MYRNRCFSFCWSAVVGSVKDLASSLVAKLMSGLVHVIHCSLPTARRYALCSSVLSGCSRSVLLTFAPGAGDGLPSAMLASCNRSVVYLSDRLTS